MRNHKLASDLKFIERDLFFFKQKSTVIEVYGSKVFIVVKLRLIVNLV